MSPARWLIVVLLAVIAALLAIETMVNVASARGSVVTAAGNGSVLAVAGQITRDNYGLYLVHLDRRTVCVYQWQANRRKLVLLAARTYAFDQQLDEYNTEPSPSEIRDMVDKGRRLDEATTQP